MINTLNESHLHKALKNYYMIQWEHSKEEQKVGPYIIDVLAEDKTALEIQTGSISRLKEKIAYLIEENYKIIVVYPLVTTKFIKLYDIEGNLKSKRKSPVHKDIYSIFRELTGIAPFLTDKNFSLHVVDVIISEKRCQTEKPVQSKNKNRRFLKNWIKVDKTLEEIQDIRQFNTVSDWLNLLPKQRDKYFSAKDIKLALVNEGIKITQDQVRLMLWVYKKAFLIKEAQKEGRTILYTEYKDKA